LHLSTNNFSANFSDILLKWYDLNKRDLPWRKTKNPYKIWLSEIILQQTRVIQGLPFYISFITNFPTIDDLANASEKKILRLWQGLGYYSRAKNLHKCSKLIVKQYSGKFPNHYSELIKLPGIGPYTAAAIASFCYKEPVAVVDGNVFRVIARFWGIKTDIASSKGIKKFNVIANQLIDRNHPDTYNQAIMEFGAIHCTPKNPSCNSCPLMDGCYSYLNHTQNQLPVKLKKIKIKNRYFYYIIIEMNGEIIMKEREDKDIWQGLYDFPLVETIKKENIETVLKVLSNKSLTFIIDNISKEYKHILTHQRIHARFIKVDVQNNNIDLPVEGIFFSKNEMSELPKPILINNYLNQYIF